MVRAVKRSMSSPDLTSSHDRRTSITPAPMDRAMHSNISTKPNLPPSFPSDRRNSHVQFVEVPMENHVVPPEKSHLESSSSLLSQLNTSLLGGKLSVDVMHTIFDAFSQIIGKSTSPPPITVYLLQVIKTAIPQIRYSNTQAVDITDQDLVSIYKFYASPPEHSEKNQTLTITAPLSQHHEQVYKFPFLDKRGSSLIALADLLQRYESLPKYTTIDINMVVDLNWLKHLKAQCQEKGPHREKIHSQSIDNTWTIDEIFDMWRYTLSPSTSEKYLEMLASAMWARRQASMPSIDLHKLSDPSVFAIEVNRTFNSQVADISYFLSNKVLGKYANVAAIPPTTHKGIRVPTTTGLMPGTFSHSECLCLLDVFINTSYLRTYLSTILVKRLRENDKQVVTTPTSTLFNIIDVIKRVVDEDTLTSYNARQLASHIGHLPRNASNFYNVTHSTHTPKEVKGAAPIRDTQRPPPQAPSQFLTTRRRFDPTAPSALKSSQPLAVHHITTWDDQDFIQQEDPLLYEYINQPQAPTSMPAPDAQLMSAIHSLKHHLTTKRIISPNVWTTQKINYMLSLKRHSQHYTNHPPLPQMVRALVSNWLMVRPVMISDALTVMIPK